ncbi:hypothetical protein B9Z55_027599 [Caenorhabditis nigoni]|uniref:Integrase catalytic domain-containing protein n=1 Tax=Caenorhabditis nigoni TaxID=1611254 RepID=A0A2G5SFM1_9PELO|nr:hypothetical protein B9Z55_027599 [Caenorhabditis nigoni]
MGSFPETTAPFQRIHADFIGPLPETSRGNKHIATFVCSFSKFMIAEPSVDQTAETLCNIFTDRVISRFGTPKLLITDQGRNFMSKKVRRPARQNKLHPSDKHQLPSRSQWSS